MITVIEFWKLFGSQLFCFIQNFLYFISLNNFSLFVQFIFRQNTFAFHSPFQTFIEPKNIFNIELLVLLLSGRTTIIKPIYNCNSKTLLHSSWSTLIVPKMSHVMRFYRPTELSKEFPIECIVWHFLWLVMNYITRLWTQDDLRACRIGVVIQRPFEFKNELSTTWVFFIFRRSQLWISTLTLASSASQSKCIQV